MGKKGVTKDNLSVTINKEILQKFNEYCDKNSINRSGWVEKKIKGFLEGKK